MTPDEQEAESRKYSGRRIQLMRLESGAIAVFDSRLQLLEILPEEVDFEAIGNVVHNHLEEAFRKPLPEYIPPSDFVANPVSADLLDIDLKI